MIGYVMGCKITKKDLALAENTEEETAVRLGFASYIKVIWYSVFIRASYFFFLVIGFLVIQFSFVGVVISIIGIVVDYILLIRHAKMIESTLPFDYLQRAGQLSIFGYNVLSDGSGQNEHFYNDVSMNYNEDMSVDKNDNNEQVQITTASFAKFGKDLDEPMVLNQAVLDKGNEDEVPYKACDVNESGGQAKAKNEDVHVNEDIFSRSETDSGDDTSSNIR